MKRLDPKSESPVVNLLECCSYHLRRPPPPLPRPPRPLPRPPLPVQLVRSDPWNTRDKLCITGSVGKKHVYLVSLFSRGDSPDLNSNFILWHPKTSSISSRMVTLSIHFGRWMMVASRVDTKRHFGPKCGSRIKTPSLSGSGLT